MILGNCRSRAFGKSLAKPLLQRFEFAITSRHNFEELNGKGSRNMGRGFAAGVFIGFRAIKAAHRYFRAYGVDFQPLPQLDDFVELQLAFLDALIEPMAVAALHDPFTHEASDAHTLLFHLKLYENGVFTVHLSARFLFNTP
ncbi:MAG: hypothetical protein AAFO63_13660 [Pseudomonadota bacterium]